MRSLGLSVVWIAASLCTGTNAQDPVRFEPHRPRDTGPFRFERLDPKVSGVEFQNELLEQNRLPYVYSGSGVAVGDFDNDGRPDIYLVSLDGKNRLFRQTGDLEFEDVTDSAGVDGGDAWGWGAVFADIDGDRDLDLYVANLESPDKLYRNDGDGTFTECAEAFGLGDDGAGAMPAFADYDRDGDLDLYLLRNRSFGMQLIRPLLNRVKLPGEITRSLDELVPELPQIRVGQDLIELDETYRNHLFVVEGRTFFAGQPDILYRNDGGRFVDVTAEAGIADYGMGLSVTWWDFDDDGWLDLYVANDLQWPDQLYRNRGDGSFEDVTKEALPTLAFFGMGSDFGDVDGDGRFDLIVADMAMRRHFDAKVLMGNMDAQAWFLENGPGPQVMRNNLFLNTGTGAFLEVANMTKSSKTNWTWALRFADLDSDGRLDIFATNGIPRFDDDPDVAMKFSDLWNDGRIREAIRLAATIPPRPDRNIALRNLMSEAGGLPKFRDVAPEWGLDEMSIGQGASLADLDRDGDLDIVVNNQNQDASIFVSRGGGRRHSLTVRLEGVDDNTQAIGARISARVGDQRIERLVVTTRGFLGGSEAIEHFGLGEATTVDSLIVDWPSGSRTELKSVAADQLVTIRDPKNGGAREDDAEPEDTKPWFADSTARLGLTFRHVETEFDDFAEQPLVPHRHSRLGPALAIGDFDADGDQDLFVGGARGQAGVVYRNEGGVFEQLAGPWSAHASSEDLGALWFDSDGDGDLDLLVTSGSNEAPVGDPSYRDRLYRNEGESGFVHVQDALPDHADATMVVRCVDFDADGDLDLFVGGRIERARYPYAPPSRLYRNDGGRFSDVSELAPSLADAGLVTDALWTDLDGDARPDLVVAAQWRSLLALRNTPEGFVDCSAEYGLDRKRGLWHGLGAGDFDGDGDIDLVATNLGTNTKYSASADAPARLYVDDFDGDGVLDVVEAKFEDGRLLPVRGRSCSSNAIPILGEKFPTFEEFAGSSLPEIYGEDALTKALTLEVDDLHHTLWRRSPDGFEPEWLPALAQVAPTRGVAVADFDGDGIDDLALGQNFFPNEPETGRMAGGFGLVLRGTEDGLVTVSPRVSGLILREDTVALRAADIDGDGHLDLVAATNQGGVRVYRRLVRD